MSKVTGSNSTQVASVTLQDQVTYHFYCPSIVTQRINQGPIYLPWTTNKGPRDFKIAKTVP